MTRTYNLIHLSIINYSIITFRNQVIIGVCEAVLKKIPLNIDHYMEALFPSEKIDNSWHYLELIRYFNIKLTLLFGFSC